MKRRRDQERAECIDKKEPSGYFEAYFCPSASRRISLPLLRVASFLILRMGILTFLVLPVGCAGLGKSLEPPRINLSNVQFQESKALETVFQIDLRVFNTNDVPIKVKGLDCDLELNGRRFATGVSNVDTEIPAFGTVIVPVTLYSSVVDLFRGMLGLHKNQALKFGVSGRLHLEGGFLIPPAYPFKAEEELALEGLDKRR
jgi:LEA14-like dessication related protein